MNLTSKDVAKILLDRQNSKFSFILDGLTRTKLGRDGFKYALQRGWVELDDSTSCMRLSQKAVKLAELNSEVISESGKPILESAAVLKSGSHDISLAHATEYSMRYNPDNRKLGEKLDVQVITGPDSSWRPFELVNSSTSKPTTRVALSEADVTYNPGDQVVIGEDGQQYYATVQYKQADGKLVLSFGDKKPRTLKPTYDPTEVAKPDANKPGAPMPPKPVTPQVQVAGGPAAPGIGR